MLQVSIWTRLLTLFVVLGGILVALPNALPETVRAKMPSWLPSSTVNLGLDLQGGSYLLLQVDLEQVTRDRAEAVVGDIRAGLRRARIPFTNLSARGDTVTVRVSDPARMEEARKLVQGLNPSMSGSVMGVGGSQYDFSSTADGGMTLKMTDAYKTLTRQQVLDQSIEVVRRRIDELGTREPAIERSGDDRILVQVPGLQDPTQLKNILGKTAKMTFQLVDEQANPESPIAPIGSEILTLMESNANLPPQKIVVQRRVMVSGDRLTDAGVGFDQQTGRAVVTFRFDSVGARQFGDVTKANVNHRFAIVLDKQVISAPNIQEPILGGSGQITGNFTAASANDLAILLRAGSLPAKLTIVEERSIGPGLGADSIRAGKIASIIATVAVCAFMIATYGVLGWIANIALLVNVILIFSIVTLLGATLSLPGIAGVIITVGTAVDSNVLIYERIREEFRSGRSAIASIDSGFHRALGTILDANITTLIAAVVLFYLGSGPIRGFAVTHAIGVATTMFTAFTFTRLLVAMWVRWRRPTKITL